MGRKKDVRRIETFITISCWMFLFFLNPRFDDLPP
jgi:hypothetical protein